MNTRLLIIFGASIIMAIGIAFLTRQILQPPVKALDVKVLAATHDLTVGTKVTKADLTWQNWSSDNVNSSYITDANSAEADKIIDAIVRYTVIKGEPILASKFVHPNDKSLLSAIISPGKRAFTLQMGKRSNLTGLISPGDLIDIVIASKNQNQTRNQNTMGKTIVRKVPVIATDGRLSRDDSVKNPEPPEEVTIEVTPAEAERLAAALQDSKPTITVYSLTNASVTEIVPEEETATQSDEEPKVEPVPEPEPYQDASSQHTRTITILRGSEKMDVNLEVDGNPNHHNANAPKANNNGIFNHNNANNQQIQGRM